MNYLKVYCNLIRKAQQRQVVEGYTEKHHIFPVSIFGKNNKVVVLTGREHYLAHVLLERVYLKRYGINDWKTMKMINAHICMKNNQKYYNSYLYQKTRKRFSDQLKNSPKTKEISRMGGQKTYELGIALFALTEEEKFQRSSKGGKRGGNTNKINKTGVCGRSKEKMIEDGKKSGIITYQMGVGVHGRTKEKRIEDARKGGLISGKISNSQKWQCLVTGYISTAPGLSNYQRKRNIDTSQRIRVF